MSIYSIHIHSVYTISVLMSRPTSVLINTHQKYLQGLMFLSIHRLGLALRSESHSTFESIAEGVPSLTQVLTHTIVHNAHMAKAALGVGVGGWISNSRCSKPSS